VDVQLGEYNLGDYQLDLINSKEGRPVDLLERAVLEEYSSYPGRHGCGASRLRGAAEWVVPLALRRCARRCASLDAEGVRTSAAKFTPHASTDGYLRAERES
jgi:hypothetical protein